MSSREAEVSTAYRYITCKPGVRAGHTIVKGTRLRSNFGSGALMAADNKLIILDKGELIIAGATPDKNTERSPRPGHRRQMLDHPPVADWPESIAVTPRVICVCRLGSERA
ncbi:MAG TPA: hypothetical protein VK530_07750 [Candidatus Acidoferrum sp.]|nr:hypothetical protein [Candidatus Acidoferrum sp.]